ncbi:HlyD family efflux transporter periplasmic adaptor subunit [Sphingomonas fennica]|uniref:EmrA/EmrK family multidrug efflux transporter periplasmic adaptor subunit n=1 Tax=Edaphosphingomonas fennica TaxID=114404 RepID=A0A2T4I4F7_9SPHN|nr:HlyD family efflux transporter periplasmic adaptor subunit [Sphingomonas fennica]PTD24292.1 EmrA/EmrK family multidrug efflux transporter periplasmic adaptor subunit [Sphingomonas fennica]
MAEADPQDLQAPRATGAAPSGGRPGLRKRLLTGLAAVVILAGVGYGVWYLLIGSRHATTDNAYVNAETAQITPLIAAQVIEVAVSDTQAVKRGDVLVRLDDSDARIAVAEAEAELARAQRQFGRTSASSEALAAQVRARQAEIERAQAELVSARAAFAKAQVDFDRRAKLAPSGAVSGDELTSATNALAAARANLETAQAGVAQANSTRIAAAGDLAANDAIIAGTTVSTNPDVRAAQAKLDKARLDLSRTVIRPPIDGIVTRRQVQLGQRVAAGTVVMMIVPVDQAYVDANFKEGQLKHVRIGQTAELTSDLYGDGVVYHGKVVGLAGGTGSSFALIPAQNATGNWIKVVQRLPVRIQLDPKELREHPLRVGLSMEVDVDISNR